MGIFQKLVNVYNRAPVELYVMFDGQRKEVPPGLSQLPDITIPYAKNQNPVMGSADPNNPQMSGARYLIVEENHDGYGVPMDRQEWEAHMKRPCRIDEEAAFAERYGNDPKARQVLHGKGKKTIAGSRYEAGGNPGGLASFEADK